MGTTSLTLIMDSLTDSAAILLKAGMVKETVEETLQDEGEKGQTAVVWFSMGVAMWQVILMARHLMFSGKSPLSGVIEAPSFLEILKQYAKNYRAGDIIDRSDDEEEDLGRIYGEGKLWGANARSFIKLMRYVAKFLGTFDKYRKKNSS